MSPRRFAPFALTATIALLASALVATTLSSTASAGVDLRYRWKKGQTYRFSAKTKQTVNLAAPGMTVDAEFRIATVFALHVDRVDAAGTASGVLEIQRFDAVTADGRKIAAIDKLPKRALVNLVDIDAKGRFAFKEVVYLLVPQEGGAVLASASVGPDGAQATASAHDGNEEVTVYARFDAKTGRVEGGAKIRKLKKRKVKVAALRSASRVDVVPFGFLSMLRLPDGAVQAGAEASMTAAGYRATTKVVAADAASAKLTTDITTQGGGAARPTTVTTTDPDGTGLDLQMPGVPDGMGMPGPGGPGSLDVAGPAQALKLEGSFASVFDVRRGMLARIEGWMSTKMAVAGVALDSRATLKLVPLK